jgi:hypothetical protein
VLFRSIWYHVALVRSSNAIKFYVNGTDITTGTPSDSSSYSGAFAIGGEPSSGGGYFAGNIDEFAISDIARWTSNFTPPDWPYGIPRLSSPMWFF